MPRANRRHLPGSVNRPGFPGDSLVWVTPPGELGAQSWNFACASFRRRAKGKL